MYLLRRKKKSEFTYYIRWNFKKILLQPDVLFDGFFTCEIITSLGLFKSARSPSWTLGRLEFFGQLVVA